MVKEVKYPKVDFPEDTLPSPNLTPSVFPVFDFDFERAKIMIKNDKTKIYRYQSENDRITVVKELQIRNEEEAIKLLERERDNLTKCNHKNIVRCFRICEKSKKLYIEMEYMDMGSLFHINEHINEIEEAVVSFVAYEVLQGLHYLHKELNIIHRDIKPSNILVNSKGEVKISDLGISKQMAATMAENKTFAGTKPYMSPERLLGQKYTIKSDIWSLGLTLWSFATGAHPYEKKGVELGYFRFLEMIVKGPVPELPDSFSDDFKDFLSKCVKVDPDERESALKLIKHPFIKKSTSLTVQKHLRVSLLKLVGWAREQ